MTLNLSSSISTLVCFSHLRWNFVYQRPQHLMARFGKVLDVLFIEEPVIGGVIAGFRVSKPLNDTNVTVLVPHLPAGLSEEEVDQKLSVMMRDLMKAKGGEDFISWFYSPMALSFASAITPVVTVYDCMDELSAFDHAPLKLKEREALLLSQSDVVFTGGHHLFAAKRDFHSNIYPFPSSIDRSHFAVARGSFPDPEDQRLIPHPRIGYYGVLDERLDLQLINDAALARPEWQFVLVGPVVKIDPKSLPRLDNIHYLGGKMYSELPTYLAGWDLAMMPFALNASTEFISPTKTPEFLAGGKFVISTPIIDVVNDYGKAGLVSIAGNSQEFISAAEEYLTMSVGSRDEWLRRVDKRLEHDSWDNTWDEMNLLIEHASQKKLILK